MLGDERSHGLWERTAPPAPAAPPLVADAACDVAIVGGGYTGLSAALHLAEGGRKVVVLEAAEVGFGASGRNSGLVNAGLWLMPDDVVAALGPTYGRRLIDRLTYAPREVFALVDRFGIDCEADRRGTYHCAVGEGGWAQINARAAQWKALGVKLDVLDAANTQARVGPSVYGGSLFDDRAGTIQPLGYARGLAAAALTKGAAIHAQSIVDGFERAGAEWRLRCNGKTVKAEWLLLATDAYSRAGAAVVQADQFAMPYFHVATEPLPEAARAAILPKGGGAWNTRTVLSGFRLDRAGRLVLGSVGALEGAARGVHRAWAKRAIATLFPQIGEVSLESEWYGLIGMTLDHLPRLHTYGEKAVGISGYNGRGIAPGTALGADLARLVLGEIALEAMPLAVSPIEPPSFRALREAYYAVGAAVAHFPLTSI